MREVCDHAKHFAQHLSLSFDLVDHFVCTFHIVSIVCQFPLFLSFDDPIVRMVRSIDSYERRKKHPWF